MSIKNITFATVIRLESAWSKRVYKEIPSARSARVLQVRDWYSFMEYDEMGH